MSKREMFFPPKEATVRPVDSCWWRRLIKLSFRTDQLACTLLSHFVHPEPSLTCDAFARSPQRTRTVAATIEMLTLRNPAVSRVSCQGFPLCPAAVIGDAAAVPKAAPRRVVSQFA